MKSLHEPFLPQHQVRGLRKTSGLEILGCVAMAVIAIVIACIPWPTYAASAHVTEGHVTHIRDADTIEVSGLAVRLDGVDAPERDTEAGQAATVAMQAAVQGAWVRCELTGKRTYDREVGTCFLTDGTDIGAMMIQSGFALDCPRYSKGRYRDLEPANARTYLTQQSYCNPR